MEDRNFERVGAVSAALVAILSLLYAIAYLGIAPAAQRGSDIDAFFRSYLAHPAGLRIASACLLVSGLVIGFAVVAVAGRLKGVGGRLVSWAAIAGVAAGLATAAHGLADLVGVDKLAHRYAAGDAAVRAAVVTVHAAPSAVDPRGVITFGATGLVALALGVALRRSGLGKRLGMGLGTLGIVLGVDMVLLFAANAAGVNGLVLLTGGLASVVLGPAWWLAVARWLWSTPAPIATRVTTGSLIG
jgi:hypothetical protein